MPQILLTTIGQKKFFMQLWRRLLAKHPEMEESDRQELISQVTKGRTTSLTQVGRVTEFTQLVARVKALIDPSDLNAQFRAARMPQINALTAVEIERRKLSVLLAAPGETDPAAVYLGKLLVDRFGKRSLDSLGVQELNHLRITLHARVTALSTKLGLSGHDVAERAGVRCSCAHCATIDQSGATAVRARALAHA